MDPANKRHLMTLQTGQYSPAKILRYEKIYGRGRFGRALRKAPGAAVGVGFTREEGSPSKRDYRRKGTLILTSLLEDRAAWALRVGLFFCAWRCCWGGFTGRERQTSGASMTP